MNVEYANVLQVNVYRRNEMYLKVIDQSSIRTVLITVVYFEVVSEVAIYKTIYQQQNWSRHKLFKLIVLIR